MAVRYVISRRSGFKHCAYVLEAEYADGSRELLGLFEYRIAIRRVGQELARLAPVTDETLKHSTRESKVAFA